MRKENFLNGFYWDFVGSAKNDAKEAFARLLVINFAERLMQVTGKSTYAKFLPLHRTLIRHWKKEIDAHHEFEKLAPVDTVTGMIIPTTKKAIEKKLAKRIGVRKARAFLRDHFKEYFLPVLDVNSHRERYIYLPRLFDEMFEIRRSPDSFKTVPYSRFFLIDSEAEAQKVLRSTFRNHNIKWKYFKGLYERKRIIQM